MSGWGKEKKKQTSPLAAISIIIEYVALVSR